MDRFDLHKPPHAAAHDQVAAEPQANSPSPSSLTGLPSERAVCPLAEPSEKADSMTGQVEGLQAVLQDSSTALQQELMTAEARMEVGLSLYGNTNPN